VINIAAVRKLELYSGDANSLDANSILSSVIPVAEDQLGAVNNQVDQGLKFPPTGRQHPARRGTVERHQVGRQRQEG
jgi:hypothetical protein